MSDDHLSTGEEIRLVHSSDLHVDDDRIFDSFGPGILGKLLPQSCGVHPNDRFLTRIERCRFSQRIQSDRVFFQALSGSVEGLFGEVPEEMAQATLVWSFFIVNSTTMRLKSYS